MSHQTHSPAELTSRRSFHRAPQASRRRDLVDAALDCIAELGLSAATIRVIAPRAGVTAGLVRHYFASKEMLIQAAYRSFMASMTERGFAPQGSAESRLAHFILANLQEPVANSRNISIWAAFVGQVRVDPALALIHHEAYLTFRDTLEELIAEFLAAHGEKPERGTCRRHAIAINGLIDGLWLERGLAAHLFSETELADIALSSAEKILGQSLSRHTN